MSAERQSFAQLESAKYLIEEPVIEDGAGEPSQAAAQPRPLSLEDAFRWISPLVAVVLLVVAGTWFWQNQNSVSSGAQRFRQRTSNPFNFLLWLKGEDFTVEEAVAESQHQFKSQFGNFESSFTQEFKPIDLSNLHYQPNRSMGKGSGDY